MDLSLLIENLTNPALLFFVLGILAVFLKSDLEIPKTSSSFISLYLLFSIGFRGGQELAHSELSTSVVTAVLTGILSAIIIPVVTFFILKKKLGIPNAGAVAAAYGSVSAVTFVTTVAFLEAHNIEFGGHMIAIMAMMEAPSIIMGVLLVKIFSKNQEVEMSLGKLLKHSLVSGSVLLIVGSLVIGFIATEQQAEGIRPFTTELFKGFLAVFLLDMGITSGKKLSGLWKNGLSPILFAIITPLFNGSLMAVFSSFFFRLCRRQTIDYNFSSKCVLHRSACCHENFCTQSKSRIVYSHGTCSNVSGKHYHRNTNLLSNYSNVLLTSG